MNDYQKAFERVIGHEGGYVNDPDDPGGETKFGISKRSYPNLEIETLTLKDAKKIYYNDFWLKQKCDQLEENIAIELFDTSVNMGNGQGAKIFQKALNLTNRNQKDYHNIKVDGGIGPKTLKAYEANKNERRLYNVMNILQGAFYVDIMERNEVAEKYVGWFDRVTVVKKY